MRNREKLADLVVLIACVLVVMATCGAFMCALLWLNEGLLAPP